jgi:serine/threonine protein kinase/tetratricopeptide (TPR) repeat protein
MRGASEERAGVALGAFVLHAPIGRGGMGEVWGGVHPGTGQPVAVKVVRVSEGGGGDFARTFRAEVQAAARLHHPNIIHVFDYGEISQAAARASGGALEEGSPYLVMELAAGGSLKELGMPRSWSELRAILLQVLDALAHAHARGVIHRDIKPGNLLVTDDEGGVPALKLSDFGIATAIESTGSRIEGPAAGTPYFMSPEQIHGLWRDQGPWTDLYSVGCLAVQLLTGYPPFYKPGQSVMDVVRAHVYTPLPRITPLLEAPPGLQSWLGALLAKSPRERLKRAADAAFQLMALGNPAWSPEGAEEALIETLPSAVKTAQGRSLPPLRVTVSLPSAGWTPEATPGTSAPPLPRSWERPAASRWSATLAGAGLGLFGVRPAPFVGRRSERDALWSALRQVLTEGRPRAVLIEGEGGVGKSRLVEWFTERAHEVGAATILHATHTQRGARTDGAPHMLARLLQCAGLRRDHVLDRVEVLLQDLDPTGAAREDAAALAELMAPALDHDDTGEFPRIRFANPEERHRVIARLLRLLAAARPVILWLDDLQWGSDAVALAQHLLRAEEPLPLLLVGVSRAEPQAEREAERRQLDALARLPRARRLPLAPLPLGEHRELVRALLGLEGSLAEEVAVRTEGRPLFATQLIGDWVQRGVLEPGERGFRLRAGEQIKIPADLFDVLLARLHTLIQRYPHPQAVQQSLEIAAALGQSVDEEDWRLVCRRCDVAVPDSLIDTLVRQRVAARTELGFAFTEALIHEALERASQQARRWTRLHRVCAGVVRDRYGEEAPVALQRIASHLLLAGEPAEALHPLLRSATLHRLIGDYLPAQTLLQQATALVNHLKAPPLDPRRAEILLEFTQLAFELGELQRAESYLQAAERVVLTAHHREDLLALSQELRARAAELRGDLDDALHGYELALDTWTQLGDMREVARALLAIGQVARLRGDHDDALRRFGAAHAILDRAAPDELLAFALHGLGASLAAQRQHPGAEAHLLRAVSLFQQLEHRTGLARTLHALGNHAAAQDHPDEAEEYLTRALRLAESTGFREAPLYRLDLALTHLAANRLHDARRAFEQARMEVAATGQQGLLGVAHAGLAAVAALQADWRAFDAQIDPALRLLLDSGWVHPNLPTHLEHAGDAAPSPR